MVMNSKSEPWDWLTSFQRKKRAELSRAAAERSSKEAGEKEMERVKKAEAEMEEGRALSSADVLRRAAEVNTAGVDAIVGDVGLVSNVSAQVLFAFINYMCDSGPGAYVSNIHQ